MTMGLELPVDGGPVAAHVESVVHASSALLPYLDMVGLAVFAASGALTAARMRQTLVTLMYFAAVTGVGGGSLRDLLIGAPVFWMHDSLPISICLATALAVWFTPYRWWPMQALEWLDGVGLAAYAVFGAAKALAWGIAPLPAAIMGVVSASMGGIFRDLLAGMPSIVVRPELYVTAAACAAGGYVALIWAGVGSAVAAGLAFAAGVALRGAAIHWKLALPAYRR